MNSDRPRHKLGKRLKALSPALSTLEQDTALTASPRAPRELSAIASLSGVALTIISLSVSEASALEHSSKEQISSRDASISRPDSRNLFIDQTGPRVALDWQSIEIAGKRAAQQPSSEPSSDIASHVVLLDEQEQDSLPEAQAPHPTILAVGDSATVTLANGLSLKLTLASALAPAEAAQEVILRDEPDDAPDLRRLNLLAEEFEEWRETTTPPFNADFLKNDWRSGDTVPERATDQPGAHTSYLESALANIDFAAFAQRARGDTPSQEEEATILATYQASQFPRG